MAISLAALPDVVHRIVEEIREHPKVAAIFLFGSWARGEQMPISDVDIAVLLDNPDKSDEAEQDLLEAADLFSKVEEVLTVAKREVTHQDG